MKQTHTRIPPSKEVQRAIYYHTFHQLRKSIRRLCLQPHVRLHSCISCGSPTNDIPHRIFPCSRSKLFLVRALRAVLPSSASLGVLVTDRNSIIQRENVMLRPSLSATDAAPLLCETRPYVAVPKLRSFLPSIGCGAIAAMGTYSGWCASRVCPTALLPRISHFFPFHDLGVPAAARAAARGCPAHRPLRIFTLPFPSLSNSHVRTLRCIPSNLDSTVSSSIRFKSYCAAFTHRPRRNHGNSK
ncbi:hypothetical protein B0H19DRAFT_1272246 [Mycena capillaripes]|nr:hypothetical protein B0H19DRAFT_1272246 [Mycena capillaripes]